MTRQDYHFTAQRPIEAAAYVEKILDERREEILNDGCALGVFTTFESNIFEYREFFHSLENVLEDVLEGICKTHDINLPAIKKSKFDLNLTNNPSKEGQGRDIASASLSRTYNFKIEKTPVSFLSETSYGSYLLGSPHSRYSLHLVEPVKNKIFSVSNYNYISVSDIISDIPKRYRKEIIKSISNIVEAQDKVA